VVVGSLVELVEVVVVEVVVVDVGVQLSSASDQPMPSDDVYLQPPRQSCSGISGGVVLVEVVVGDLSS